MDNLYIIKLGGSVITEKEGNKFEAKKEVIARIASEVKNAMGEAAFRLIVVHGVGPFGHTNVVEYDIDNGVHSERQKEGLAKTIRDCSFLDSVVVEAFRNVGINAVAFDPNGFVTQDKKKVVDFPTDGIEKAVSKGEVPMLFGQMVQDKTLKASVISGDTIVGFLGKTLKAGKIFLGTDVAGIFTADPKKDANAERIPVIDKENFDEVVEKVAGSANVDVTGGMKGKLEELRAMVSGSEALIFDANKEGSFYNALVGENVEGTKVVL